MPDFKQNVKLEQDSRETSINGRMYDQSSQNANASPAKTLRDQGLSDPLNLVPEDPSSMANHINSNHSDNKQAKADRFDPNFTQSVINATGPKASPRMRKVMASMIQHIHDFARENEITVDEWMAGVEMVYSPYSSRTTVPPKLPSNPVPHNPDQRSGPHVHGSSKRRPALM